MDSGDPEVWRWIWLIAAVVFGVGEMAAAGSFFLAPFAIGAVGATVCAFAGVGLAAQWAVFLALSVATFAGLRPLAHKLAHSEPTPGVGGGRQVGQRGRVIEAIDGEHDHGMVQLDREKWRAVSSHGQPIAEGVTVSVIEVRGTRVVVEAISSASAVDPSGRPSSPPSST